MKRLVPEHFYTSQSLKDRKSLQVALMKLNGRLKLLEKKNCPSENLLDIGTTVVTSTWGKVTAPIARKKVLLMIF